MIVCGRRNLPTSYCRYRSGERAFGFYICVEGYPDPDEAATALVKALNLLSIGSQPDVLVRAEMTEN